MFLTDRKKQIWNKISSFIFTKKSRFHWRKQIFRKSCYSWKRKNWLDIDGIENFDIDGIAGSPRFVFINEEYGNLKVVNDCGELNRNMNQKKKSDVSQKPVDVHSVTNVGESIFSITMHNIVNQLGKHHFSYGSVVNNLKDRKLLLDATGVVLPCRI